MNGWADYLGWLGWLMALIAGVLAAAVLAGVFVSHFVLEPWRDRRRARRRRERERAEASWESATRRFRDRAPGGRS